MMMAIFVSSPCGEMRQGHVSLCEASWAFELILLRVLWGPVAPKVHYHNHSHHVQCIAGLLI